MVKFFSFLLKNETSESFISELFGEQLKTDQVMNCHFFSVKFEENYLLAKINYKLFLIAMSEDPKNFKLKILLKRSNK